MTYEEIQATCYEDRGNTILYTTGTGHKIVIDLVKANESALPHDAVIRPDTGHLTGIAGGFVVSQWQNGGRTHTHCDTLLQAHRAVNRLR